MAENSPRLPRKGTEGPPYVAAHGTGSLLLARLPCYMCTDVFSDQVTTPCGHSFCKTCLTDCWKSQRCVCPLCKKEFSTRPELEMTGALKAVADHYSKSVQPSRPDVLCDACPGVRMKALKSCLDCVLTLCESHLEPHNENKKLQKHKLIEPVENLDEYICQKHQKPLEMFCRGDQMCVCLFCTEGVHKKHHVIPLEMESDDKKARLAETQTEARQLIRHKLQKIHGIKRSQELSKKIIEKDKAESIDVFTSLIGCIENRQAELLKTMEKKQTAERRTHEEYIRELKQEIFELKRTDIELEQLLHTDDHLKLLKGYPSLVKNPPIKTQRPDIKISTDVNTGLLRTALSQLQKSLNDKFIEIELTRIQQHAVGVTLDPETAGPHLILSRDGKEVRHGHGDTKPNVPQSPKRFTSYPIVLGNQGYSSGRFYYKVQVGKKTEWELGVAGESVNRKKHTLLKPQNGFWTVILMNGTDYIACADVSVQLALTARPQKLGVFVDYEEGLVSFYDVENKSHIYSFTGQSFTEKLYPYFSPCKNTEGKTTDPLIICPD